MGYVGTGHRGTLTYGSLAKATETKMGELEWFWMQYIAHGPRGVPESPLAEELAQMCRSLGPLAVDVEEATRVEALELMKALRRDSVQKRWHQELLRG